MNNKEDWEAFAGEPLPGVVCTVYVRCSKPGCHCRDGRRHGPYYYRVWRQGDRVRKTYVKRAEVELVRAQCAAYKRHTQRLRQLSREREELARYARKSLRRQNQTAALS